MPKLELRVLGQSYGGWKSVRIQRSIEQLCGNFELSVSERWPGQVAPRPIKVGDLCVLAVDDIPLVTGHVDDVSMSYDAQSHEVTVRGRDAAGDLFDCSARYQQFVNQKLEQIATTICKPFDIPVTADVDTGKPYAFFGVDDGETAFEVLNRLQHSRGVLITSDGVGGILITRAGDNIVQTTLVHGKNILAATHDLSIREWFTDYTVGGSRQGDAGVIFANEEIGKASHDDLNPRRYRPLFIPASTQGNIGLYQLQADWERTTRRGRASRVSVTVQGWTHPDGLWQPNSLVRVRDGWLGIDGTLLIVGVTFTLHLTGGTRTELTLTPPSAFDPLKLPDRSEDAMWGALGQ